MGKKFSLFKKIICCYNKYSVHISPRNVVDRVEIKNPPCFAEKKAKNKEEKMILANQIIGKLDSIPPCKIKVMDFCKTFQVSRSYVYKLLKRRKEGKSLERKNKGGRKSIFRVVNTKPYEQQGKGKIERNFRYFRNN